MWGDAVITVPISAIEHHSYCPRQCALIHVDGLWADNVATVAGTRAHRRVDSNAHRRERGRLVLRSIPLWSERHGLSGRADAVEVWPDGRVEPVEHKSGVRHGITADLQLCAQAMCLEDMLQVDVEFGWIWYGGPRRRHRVTFDGDLRGATASAIDQIRADIGSGVLPPAIDDQRCSSCQLERVCLPGVSTHPDGPAHYLHAVVMRCDT